LFQLFFYFVFGVTVGLTDPTRTLESLFCVQFVSPCSVWVLHTKFSFRWIPVWY